MQLLFSISDSFMGLIGPKVGPKVQTLRTSCGHKNLTFSKRVICHVDTYEDYLRSKFQLNRTIIFGVIAPKLPKLGPIGSRSKKIYFVTLKGHAKFGPSVSQNKSPAKAFWLRQFTFQTKERNQI